jgi:hypothetical protein
MDQLGPSGKSHACIFGRATLMKQMITWAALIVLQAISGGVGEADGTQPILSCLNCT